MVNITPQVNGSYALDFFKYGFTTYNSLGAPLNGLFYPLSPAGGYSVILTLDYQGIGLPENLYNNFINALKTQTQLTDKSLVCQSFTGGTCKLKNVCSSYANLFQNGLDIPMFKIQFQGETNNNYITIPLANFMSAPAVGTGCQIFVQKLDPTQPGSQDIILGSMFW